MLSLKEKKKRVKENNPLDPVSLALGADPSWDRGRGSTAAIHCERPGPGMLSRTLTTASNFIPQSRTRSGAAKSNPVKGEWDQGQSWGTGCQTAQEELWTPM